MTTDWTDRIRLRNLKFLLSLAQTRNLSHSATLLHTTQPALSKWLKELESDIGLPLFERHARGLVPTTHGDVLIAHASRIQAQLDRAAVDMSVLRFGGAGRVVVGASGAAASEAAPRAVLALAQRMPDLRVDLMEGTMDRLLALLAGGDVDIVIGRTASIAEADAANIRSEVLYVEPIDLVARPDHPLFSQPQVGWEDIERYRWIVWPSQTPVRKALEAALAKANRSLPSQYIESNSVIANITLLNLSDVIGTASHRSSLMLTRLGVLRVLPFKLDGVGSVSLYWRNDGLFPKSVEAALDCIREVAADPEQ
ncbi:LysR family transcriptional regulator [Pusillimonas sp. CC-YST705]|uniref:LysR family transcriptional regulator n=1 Tax=Mesopusillimonas faecipullorum TaxID=2755040 RepID=A0ABS8CE95_9BURK|nr:LysR substrate-binding domain-containing protein [Mesopusillimonas faecipullorum]MCB5364343.1 LysR family transcriptional regulator [Mesopusillimonas faecipullorum]